MNLTPIWRYKNKFLVYETNDPHYKGMVINISNRAMILFQEWGDAYHYMNNNGKIFLFDYKILRKKDN